MRAEEGIQFVKGYNKDSHFSEVLKASGEINSKFPQYTTREDGIILFNNWTGYSRICVPKSMKFEILKEVHEGITGVAHAGSERTYYRIAQAFYWPRLNQDIRKFVTSCPVCQKTKDQRHLPFGQLQPIPIPDKPCEVFTMDIITDLPDCQGHNAIYVMVYNLTPYAYFIPCSTN